MNQIDTIKALLVKYTNQCASSEMNDIDKAAAYVEAHKPAGVGRVTPIIIQPLLAEVRQAYWDRILMRQPPEDREAPSHPIEGIQFDEEVLPLPAAVATRPAPRPFWKRLLGR